MYGMVNKAVECLVVERFGGEVWSRIQARAAVGEDFAVRMQAYPDAMTYQLVAAASEVLNLPAETVLEVFGEYWVEFAARDGFASLLEPAGQTFAGFLAQLDAMHTRIALQMPALRPPSFHSEEMPDGRIRLSYWSEREGLAPMVKGLLRGLARRFAVEVALEHTVRRGDGADHDEFLLRVEALARAA